MAGIENSSGSRLLQTLIGLGTMTVAGVLAWGAAQIPSEAGYSGIGPSFLPWAVAAVLALCAILLLLQVLRGGFRDVEPPSGADRGDWGSFAWLAAGLLLNAALIERIGFIASCALCYAFAVRGLRRAEAKRTSLRCMVLDLLTGVLIAAPVYWLFTQLLAVNLPGLTASGWL
jgi:putative tricarboxylic transport membrane protein